MVNQKQQVNIKKTYRTPPRPQLSAAELITS